MSCSGNEGTMAHVRKLGSMVSDELPPFCDELDYLIEFVAFDVTPKSVLKGGARRRENHLLTLMT